jgi:hypothetical protein
MDGWMDGWMDKIDGGSVCVLGGRGYGTRPWWMAVYQIACVATVYQVCGNQWDFRFWRAHFFVDGRKQGERSARPSLFTNRIRSEYN